MSRLSAFRSPFRLSSAHNVVRPSLAKPPPASTSRLILGFRLQFDPSSRTRRCSASLTGSTRLSVTTKSSFCRTAKSKPSILPSLSSTKLENFIVCARRARSQGTISSAQRLDNDFRAFSVALSVPTRYILLSSFLYMISYCLYRFP